VLRVVCWQNTMPGKKSRCQGRRWICYIIIESTLVYYYSRVDRRYLSRKVRSRNSYMYTTYVGDYM
jgi:hypothetical protein